jgi:hypothetical protein
VRTLVNACQPALRNLGWAAVLTGCRYLDLAFLWAAGFNPDTSIVGVRDSEAAKPRHVA